MGYKDIGNPSEIYLEKNDNYDRDLLNTIKMLLERDYDIKLRNEDGATVIEFDTAEYKGYGNSVFEYITAEEKEMIWNNRWEGDKIEVIEPENPLYCAHHEVSGCDNCPQYSCGANRTEHEKGEESYEDPNKFYR